MRRTTMAAAALAAATLAGCTSGNPAPPAASHASHATTFIFSSVATPAATATGESDAQICQIVKTWYAAHKGQDPTHALGQYANTNGYGDRLNDDIGQWVGAEAMRMWQGDPQDYRQLRQNVTDDCNTAGVRNVFG